MQRQLEQDPHIFSEHMRVLRFLVVFVMLILQNYILYFCFEVMRLIHIWYLLHICYKRPSFLFAVAAKTISLRVLFRKKRGKKTRVNTTHTKNTTQFCTRLVKKKIQEKIFQWFMQVHVCHICFSFLNGIGIYFACWGLVLQILS